MARSNNTCFRALLAISVLISLGLILIGLREAKKPFSFTNETHQAKSNDIGGGNESTIPGVSNVSEGFSNIYFDERRPSSLVLVHVLIRHGDRAPIHFYPTDPHKDEWTFGRGEMTQQGMLRCFHLGQYLRHRYNYFLGNKFNYKEIYIRSTDVHRTINCAQCVAAGFFPGNILRETFGKWQPIPIHTVPSKVDKVLSPAAVCEYVYKLHEELPAFIEAKQKLLENKELMHQLSLHTGMKMNLKNLHALADNIYCVKGHNMTLPTWLTHEMEGKLITHRLTRPSFFIDQARLYSGMLLLHILSNVLKKIQNVQVEPKMYLYSAHSTNIHALLTLLQLHTEEQIPYAAAFIMEIYEQESQHFIKLIYKAAENKPPQVLSTPGCGKRLCPLGEFVRLYGISIQEEWNQKCGNQIHKSQTPMDFEELFPLLMTGLIFFLTLILFYKSSLYVYYVMLSSYEERSEGDKKDFVSDKSLYDFYVKYGGGSNIHFKRQNQAHFNPLEVKFKGPTRHVH